MVKTGLPSRVTLFNDFPKNLSGDSRTHLLTDDWVKERPDNGNTDWYLFGYGTDYKAGLKAMTRIGGAVPMTVLTAPNAVPVKPEPPKTEPAK